jgi:hypothetical protein
MDRKDPRFPRGLERWWLIASDAPLLVKEKQGDENNHHADTDVDVGVHGFLLLAGGRARPYSHAPIQIPNTPMTRPDTTYFVKTAVAMIAAPVVMNAFDQYRSILTSPRQ